MRLLRPTLALALALAALSAQAVVVDFENLVGPGAGNYFVIFPGEFPSTPVFSGGFQFASTATNIFGPDSTTSGYNYTGSAALTAYANDPRTTMTQVGGGAFSLDRIDLANLFTNVDAQDSAVTFVGNLVGGGTVSQTFTIARGNALQTFAFAGFSDVTSVSWTKSGGYFQFDNVSVTTDAINPATPGPMAALPFALMALKRRKRA